MAPSGHDHQFGEKRNSATPQENNNANSLAAPFSDVRYLNKNLRSLSHTHLLQLQRLIGNQAVVRRLVREDGVPDKNVTPPSGELAKPVEPTGSAPRDINPQFQQQPANRSGHGLLSGETRIRVQRSLQVTGENGGQPLSSLNIRSDPGLNTAVAYYINARTPIMNRIHAWTIDNRGREIYPTWNEVVDEAAMEVLYEAVKTKDLTTFKLLYSSVRTLLTWQGGDEMTDLLSAVKVFLMVEPANVILKEMQGRLQSRIRGFPVVVPAIPHPLNGGHSLPISNEIANGIANINNDDIKTVLRLMTVYLNNFNVMVNNAVEAEKIHAVLQDIDDLIDRVYDYDSPTHSIVPLQLVLDLQTLRDAITQRRQTLNATVANANNMQLLGAGGRPDRHTSYDDLNLPNLVPAGPARQAYNAQITQGNLDGDQNPAKTKEEALSAAAAAQQYPAFFGQMTAAPRIQGLVGNVEYYDNNGDPWDQKTAFRGPGVTASDAMEKVAASITSQQGVNFPKRGLNQPSVPVGVLLDTTYVNPREYQILWMKIFQRVRAGEINLAKLKEVRSGIIIATLPALQLNSTDFSDTATDTSVAKLSQWSNGQQMVIGRDGVQRNFRTIPQATLLQRDNVGKIAGAFNGTGDAYDVYSNGNGILPGGQRYLEYSIPGTLLTDPQNKARIIRGSGGDLYITGTHYSAWTNTANATAEIPFYKIT